MNSELRFYLRILMRRLPLILFVSVLVSSIGVAVAVLRPAAYTSTGLLLVERAQIPEFMARTTVQVDAREQLYVVQRRLMTRANLLEIARTHDVYEDLAVLTPDEIVTRMRDDSRFSLSPGRRDEATIMTVAFTARSAGIAASVANDYITRILRDNSEQRQNDAQQTLVFFEQEVERLESEMDIKNTAIMEFQAANRDALPSTLNFRIARQSSLQERLVNLTRDEMVLEQRRRGLEDALENFLALQPPAELSPAERQLLLLREQLTSALAVYSDTSPRVQTLRNRVAALEGQLVAPLADEAGSDGATEAAGDGGPGEAGDPGSPARRRIATEIEEIGIQLDFIDEQKAEIEAELDDLARTISATSTNELTLGALQRELDSVRMQHAEAVANLAAAATGERIEVTSKGERVSVLEQALAPSEPSSPNRRLIAAGGIAAGLASGFGLALILEVLNRAIRRPEDLVNSLGITPLVTVPYIATPWERARRRVVPALLLVAILVGIPAGLYYIHTQIIPLDLLVDRIVARVLP